MGANQVKLWREMTASEEDPGAANNTSGADTANDSSSDNSGNSTPTRPSTLKTLPSFKDPRSPPHDPTATRTPIQVEATPGAKAATRTFDDTPLMQKVLRRGGGGGGGSLETPTTPSPATPVKNLDLSASFEGPDSKENLLPTAYEQEAGKTGGQADNNARVALTSKNK